MSTLLAVRGLSVGMGGSRHCLLTVEVEEETRTWRDLALFVEQVDGVWESPSLRKAQALGRDGARIGAHRCDIEIALEHRAHCSQPGQSKVRPAASLRFAQPQRLTSALHSRDRIHPFARTHAVYLAQGFDGARRFSRAHAAGSAPKRTLARSLLARLAFSFSLHAQRCKVDL